MNTHSGKMAAAIASAALLAAIVCAFFAPPSQTVGEDGDRTFAVAESGSKGSLTQASIGAGTQDARVVNPAVPGETLPPEGTHSLFDEVIAREGQGKIPFPFTKLLDLVARASLPKSYGEKEDGPLTGTLVPLGRSLARLGALPPELLDAPFEKQKPYFVKSPRVVVGDIADPKQVPGAPGLDLRDKIYFGYQERTKRLEVISYNEGAGRFEFQIVKDYEKGKSPQAFYVNRFECTKCHQNQAPLFPTEYWQGTTISGGEGEDLRTPIIKANFGPGRFAVPEVEALFDNPADRLRVERTPKGDKVYFFHGVPIDNPDETYHTLVATDGLSLENSVRRANLFSAFQKIWREGCSDAASRAELLFSGIVAGLTRQFPEGKPPTTYEMPHPVALDKIFAAKWPQLIIPNSVSSDVSSYDPKDFEMSGSEPVVAADQYEKWSGRDQVVGAMAVINDFLSREDLRELENASALAPSSLSKAYSSACTFDWKPERSAWELKCKKSFNGEKAEKFAGTFDFNLGFADDFKLAGNKTNLKIDYIGRQDGTDKPCVPDYFCLKHASELAGSTELRNENGKTFLVIMLRESDTGRRARMTDGYAVEMITMPWPGSRGSFTVPAHLYLRNDLDALKNAVLRLAKKRDAVLESGMPFARNKVLSAIYGELASEGLKVQVPKEQPLSVRPARVTELEKPVMATNSKVARIVGERCVVCHNRNTAVGLPSFVDPVTGEVDMKRFNACAPRVSYKLNLWNPKYSKQTNAQFSPMPYPSSLGAGLPEWENRSSRELKILQCYVDSVIGNKALDESGRCVPSEKLMEKDFSLIRKISSDCGR